MDLQAAIGMHQLGRVEAAWARRQAIWNRYQNAFLELPLICPVAPPPYVRHAHHLYTLLVDEQRCGVSRDQFLTRMTNLGIGVGVHYLALTEHPYYQQRLGWKPEDTPIATTIGRQTVSLPMSPKLTDDEVERVIAAVGLCLALA
jgi:dTDP-4-amino-4,6-dideoxygalactose transaminase